MSIDKRQYISYSVKFDGYIRPPDKHLFWELYYDQIGSIKSIHFVCNYGGRAGYTKCSGEIVIMYEVGKTVNPDDIIRAYCKGDDRFSMGDNNADVTITLITHPFTPTLSY